MWLVNISVIAVALLCVWRWRHELSPRRGRVKYAHGDQEGFAEIDVPRGWRPVGCEESSVNVKVKQTNRRRFVMILSECKGDFTPDVTIDVHSNMTRTHMAANMEVLGTRGPVHREVGGFPAVQYEIDAAANSRTWIYLLTTVAGDRAFHEIVCCAPRSQYDRTVFERMIDGFRERPGPPPPPPLHAVVPRSAGRRGYEVH